MSLMIVLFIIIYFTGLIFYLKSINPSFVKKLMNENCPNILIQRDKTFYLYNSKLEKIPGVNPIEFKNLEDYVEYLNWQKEKGIKCPVLYLQKTYDAQSNTVYKIRPSVTELKGGLPTVISPVFGQLLPDVNTQTLNTPYYINKNKYMLYSS
jgi:hypothetical protein